MNRKRTQLKSPPKSPLDNYLPNKDYYMEARNSDSQKTKK